MRIRERVETPGTPAYLDTVSPCCRATFNVLSVPTQNLWSATTDRANIALCGTQTRGKWKKNLEVGPYQATIASLDASLTR